MFDRHALTDKISACLAWVRYMNVCDKKIRRYISNVNLFALSVQFTP